MRSRRVPDVVTRALRLAALLVLPVLTTPTALAAEASPQAGAGPSFACAAAQGVVEKTVCASAALSASDRTMASLYAADRVSAFGRGPSDELAEQRKTLAAMQDCATRPSAAAVATCLQGRYDQRIYEQALAAVTRMPDRALPIIRRADPAFAPIVEAIAIWASEPEGTDWAAPARAGKRSRILALLQPTLTAILTDQDNSFARSILTDATGDGVAVRQIGDVLRSPKHFAFFLNVIGPSLDKGSGVAGRAIPCAAIVGHPALLAATGSVFGSTMDNFVLNTDCGATLPPTPALGLLGARLDRAWPPCDGTIRFAAFRTYGMTFDAARLGLARSDARAFPRRRGVSPRDVEDARAELAAYYARYLGKPPPRAAAMARDAVNAVLATAQQCD